MSRRAVAAVAAVAVAGGVGVTVAAADLPQGAPGDPAPARPHAQAREARPDAAGSPRAGGRSRPDVVVVMTDDMRTDELRFLPRTEALLADDGVRFRHAISPLPLCCPARASFLTGRYAHNHHVWSHREPYGFAALDDRATLPVVLQRSGYRTAFVGKYLNGYGEQPLPDGSPSAAYVPPGWSDWRAAVDGGLPFDVAGSTYDYLDTTLNVNGRFEAHPGEYQTSMLGAEARDVVGRLAPGRRPYFLWLSFVAPHHGVPVEADDPTTVASGRNGRAEAFGTPARRPAAIGRFDRAVTLRTLPREERDVSDKPAALSGALPPLSHAEREALVEVSRQRAEALWSVDRQVAALVRSLRRAGTLDDTVLLFTSDNGYLLGEHRYRQGKVLPYEPSLTVPLLVRGPGVPSGQVRDDPFSMVDMFPTLLDVAQVRGRHGTDGVSIWDVARLGDRGWRRPILTDTGPMGRYLRFGVGIRLRDWLLVDNVRGRDELYDLRRDPGELVNLVRRPAADPVERRLRRILARTRDCRGAACSRPAGLDTQQRPEPLPVQGVLSTGLAMLGGSERSLPDPGGRPGRRSG